jgi:protein-tyrosine phosphatase
LRARKITRDDFEEFDLIIAMDQSNLENIRHLKPDQSTSKIMLMMEFAPAEGYEEVPDPYYGTQQDFNLMCRLLDKATSGLLSHLEAELQ